MTQIINLQLVHPRLKPIFTDLRLPRDGILGRPQQDLPTAPVAGFTGALHTLGRLVRPRSRGGRIAEVGVGVTGLEIGDFNNTAYDYGTSPRHLASEANRENSDFSVASDNEAAAVNFRIDEAF